MTSSIERIRLVLARKSRELVDILGDVGVDDALLRHLVVTAIGARSALVASTIMGFFITGLAWTMTGERVFAIYFVVNGAIGVIRFSLTRGFAQLDFDRLGRRRLLACDRKFLFWSTCFALNIGMTCFSLIRLPETANVMALAMTVCIGYSVAFMTRANGRLQLALSQIFVALAGPICALVVDDRPDALMYASMCVATLIATTLFGWSTHNRSIALFVVGEANRRMARQDMLTGLPNRFSLSDTLTRALVQTDVRATPLAILTIDLDRFKDVNDTLGHSAGDSVIIEMGARLAALAAPGDFVARLGGDEFVILTLCGPRGVEHAQALAERINAILATPVLIDLESLALGCSIGMAVYPDHGSTAEVLLQRADIALYEAKRQGRNRSCMFDAAMQARLNETRLLEVELHKAICEDQFEAWYQPIYNIETKKIVGFEALARWRHPERGIVPPDQFIPLAERTDAIHAIGRSVLSKACCEAMTWPSHQLVAVNLSPVEFRRPARLVASVREALHDSGIAPHRLYLEITESLLLEESDDARRAVADLVRLGVRFSLDDFGAGYSSLSYIRDYPFSKIKIDKKFIDRIATDRKSSSIVAAVVVLAAGLDIEVVAEGVEEIAQDLALRKLGVTLAQGYLYGRPSPFAATEETPRLVI